MNVMNGLMHGAFWKSHDAGPGDVKLLQVDQLPESFGQCHQLRPREVKRRCVFEEVMLDNALWQPCNLLAALHEVVIRKLELGEALRQCKLVATIQR